jgi:hypothetical protein
MNNGKVPTAAISVCEHLRDYLHKLHPEIAKAAPLPLAFWTIESEDLFFEALAFLPLFSEHIADLEQLPEGFRLAVPIYWLEDDYQFNGWDALANAGDDALSRAIAAYARIGMESEASALAAARQVVRLNSGDSEAHASAYRAVSNPYADYATRNEALLKFFRANRHLFEEEHAV